MHLDASKTRAKLQKTKPDQQSELEPYTHFTEHLVSMSEKPPQKCNKKQEKLKPLIWWLKNKTDFHLQQSSQNRTPHTAENCQVTPTLDPTTVGLNSKLRPADEELDRVGETQSMATDVDQRTEDRTVELTEESAGKTFSGRLNQGT
jgi:hypothetical protein